MKNKLVLNQFVLKIIAIITMTIDHVGVFLEMYQPNFYNSSLDIWFRGIGRIAFPLFIFMLIEGIFHTRNVWKYMLRIGVMALVILIPEIILTPIMGDMPANPFFDLFLIGLGFAILKYAKGKLKILCVLPWFYIIGGNVCSIIEVYTRYKIEVTFLPNYLRTSYGVFGLCLGAGFYSSHLLAQKYVYLNDGDESESSDQLTSNIFSIIFILIVNIVFWAVLTIIVPRADFIRMNVQTYSILAFVPILFYNGKRGYNAKWFKYGSYVYFALHIVLLFVIFQLVYVGRLF